MAAGKTPASPRARPVWNTSRLTWFSFVRRRLSFITFARSLRNRFTALPAKLKGLPPEDQKVAAAEAHEQAAIDIREFAEQTKGMSVKACQFLSTQAELLPDVYLREFGRLTDDMPQSSAKEVRRVVEKELGRPPEQVFDAFDAEEVLGSASIAQVHRARLRDDAAAAGALGARGGRDVAVKVQHDGVDRLFEADIGTLGTIVGMVARWAPNLNLRPLHLEFKDASARELDFRLERVACDRARAALEKAGSRVLVPQTYPEYSSRRVLTMEFIDGLQLSKFYDTEFAQAHGVDRRVLIQDLVEAEGILIFKEGSYHADPHAGNVLVHLQPGTPSGAAVALLDYGLQRDLSALERVELARIFAAIGDGDGPALFGALGRLGWNFKNGAIAEAHQSIAAHALRHMLMRRSLGRKGERQRVMDQSRAFGKAIKASETKKATKKAKVAKDAAGASNVPPHNPAVGKPKPPPPKVDKLIEDWPPVVVLLFRTMSILQGLVTSLDVSDFSVFATLLPHAKAAALAAGPPPPPHQAHQAGGPQPHDAPAALPVTQRSKL